MKLKKIDLSQIVAVGHNEGQLGLLIDRGEDIEYIEIPAPRVAYDGLQYVSNFANNPLIPELDQDPRPLKGVLPSSPSRELYFLTAARGPRLAPDLKSGEPLTEIKAGLKPRPLGRLT